MNPVGVAPRETRHLAHTYSHHQNQPSRLQGSISFNNSNGHSDNRKGCLPEQEMPSAIFTQGQAIGLLARGRTRYLNLHSPNDSNRARGTYVHSTYPPHRHTHTYVHSPCTLPSGCVFTATPASQPFPSQKLPALTKTRKFILTLEFFSPSVLKA